MIRRIFNLILPPLMWLCSSLNLVSDAARSPSAMSDANPSLLVPSGIAFSIWLPIFLLCITYGVIQFLPKNKSDPLFEKIGWWTAAGFLGVCLWGLVNAYWPMGTVQMATAIVFIPTMLILVAAMFKFDEQRKENSNPRPYSFAGISMIAGWCSLAVFLNWAPQTVEWMTSAGIAAALASSLVLAIALFWIASVAWRSRGNIAYIIPPVWGLFWLIIKRVNADPVYTNITTIAGLGVASLLVISFFRRNRQTT